MKPTTSPYVTDGMPPLTPKKNTVSLFEFWPTWVMYLPVLVLWLLLSIRHRSLTLPLLANPKLRLSGMVGVPKSELFSQASGLCDHAILDWFVFRVSDEPMSMQVQAVNDQMTAKGLTWPVVCKPDIGCRGSGVKLVKSADALKYVIARYPVGSSLMIQRQSTYEPEAGVFFVKHPDQPRGQVVSLALKYSPYVVGDGQRTLRQLILDDERAGDLLRLYEARHQAQLDDVLDAGQPFKLVFSASHCRGAIFRDGREYITEALTCAIDDIMQGLPEFYYGRLDVKFKDIESLQRGEHIEIVEINGASAESLHIWDSDTRLRDAFSALLYQYRTLFKLGNAQRKKGYTTPGIYTLLRGVAAENALKKHYPTTD